VDKGEFEKVIHNNGWVKTNLSYLKSQIMGGYCGEPLAHLLTIINKLLIKTNY
jgi:hypothetical protein